MAHKQLTDRERYQIETLNTEGYTQTGIARALLMGSEGKRSAMSYRKDVLRL